MSAAWGFAVGLDMVPGVMAGRAEIDDDSRARWRRVRDRLRNEVGENAFDRWLGPLTPSSIERGRVVLAAPSRFLRDWVAPRYADRIRALWRLEDPSLNTVEIVVGAGKPATVPAEAGGPKTDSQAAEGAGLALVAGRAGDAAGEDADIPLGPDPRYCFDNFVVGKPNEFAHAAARRLAESDEVSFNPLFLYGGVGLGKTHLMHAIAWRIRQRTPKRKVLYVSAEQFMHRFIKALRFKSMIEFKELFRSVDVLMVDDVQFIGGREATQEEFFHTFNALVEHGSQIVISSDRSPGDLEQMDERMRSRLGWGLVAEVHATTYELRLGILQAKAEQSGYTVPAKVIEFLAHRISSNVRELEGALIRVIAHAQLVGRTLTLDVVQDVLHDLLRSSERRVLIEEIQKRVAEFYNIKISEMSSARRARAVARPRQVAMYLAKILTARSLPEIGRKFGNRDHTTVMHAVKRVEQLRQADASFAEDLELLRRTLGG